MSTLYTPRLFAIGEAHSFLKFLIDRDIIPKGGITAMRIKEQRGEKTYIRNRRVMWMREFAVQQALLHNELYVIWRTIQRIKGDN